MKHLFFQCITDFIFVEHTLKPADILFVPGGNYPQAALGAAQLFKQGMAPLILPSGRCSILKGCFEGPWESEWDYLRSVLMRAGVPENCILREDRATYTYENAIRSREVLEEQKIRVERGIICCQAFHARRCLLYYQEQFPDTELMVSPVVTKGITRENWYLTRQGIDTVLGEVERCGSQFHQIMYSHMEEMKNLGKMREGTDD